MTKINLLPPDIKIKEDRPELAFLFMIVVVFAGLSLIYVYVSKIVERKSIRNEIMLIEKELGQLQLVVNKINQIKTEKDLLNARKSAIEELVKKRLLYPILMENLVKNIPPGMWLRNLNTVPGDIKTSIRFDATAYNNYIIADLLRTLEESKIFEHPEISGITSIKSDKDIPLKQFSITVDYVNQGWQ
ncbi:MAG: Fimbrial assembly protein (PilN) [Elusimicrobia bacterium ADurb.Bin231]|nr:MAG: Fimbrial assembly protein (PilN) [Elusimicrobia bacterium ADurb.Bin231]